MIRAFLWGYLFGKMEVAAKTQHEVNIGLTDANIQSTLAQWEGEQQ